jgi:putative hemolysin
MNENHIVENEPRPQAEKMDRKKQFTTVTPFSKALAMLLLIALPFVGFWFGYQYAVQDQTLSQPPVELVKPAPQATLSNPASQNCVRLGGTLEIRTSKAGQYGVCLFEDNRQCEEWALLRGECAVGGVKITGYDNDAEIYCAITGGRVEGVGTETPMCKRIDGTYCAAQANLDGECPDPHDPNPNAGNVEAP